MNGQAVMPPKILCVYAVDIGPDTFPMELYWSTDDDLKGEVVDPAGITALDGRHEKYMEVHSISYKDLADLGKSPKSICEALNNDLGTSKVYVEDQALERTKSMLDELYKVGMIRRGEFEVSSLEKFLNEQLLSCADRNLSLDFFKQRVSERYAHESGAVKAEYMRQLCELVFQEIKSQ